MIFDNQAMQTLLQTRVHVLELELALNAKIPIEPHEVGEAASLGAALSGAIAELVFLARYLGFDLQTRVPMPLDPEQSLYPSSGIVEHMRRQAGDAGDAP